MDQSIAIQETLAEDENCIIAAQCFIVEGSASESRLLGLVKHRKEHALFLYTHCRMAITGDDVSLEGVIPISYNFAIVEVSSPDELAVVGSDTRLRITYMSQEVELKLPFGSHSRLFLGEVNKAWSDVCQQYPGATPKFDWLSKYKRKAAATRGSLKQSLTPLVEPLSKLGPNRKAVPSEKSQTDERRRGTTEENHRSSSGPPGSPAREAQVSPHEQRNEQAQPSIQTQPSPKAQMLSLPQFGLRDSLIRYELLKNEDIYTYLKNFSFFLGTYNVNGQTPKENLSPWLASTSDPPDVYCIGFQELDLSKEAFIFNDTPKEPEWMKAVFDGLHPGAKYAFVKHVRLVGIMLLCFVKAEHAEHIAEVEAETVGTGIMGRMGNKGGVAIRFRFHNSDVCVVNSHLAAHIEEYERRNQDYREICSRMQFRQQDPDLPPLTIMKHNIVLWLGDLNYRISNLEVDQVKDMILKKDFETLCGYDQLKRQMDVEAVFQGFTEGEIDFQPTYKYDTGSSQWDSSEKCRVPAWCDRILWRGKNVRQLHYGSHMALKTSDHKPVSSLLEIGIKVINEESYKRTFEEIVRSLDKMENECIPSVSLSQREFLFQDVKFMQHRAETLTIHNDGQVPCQFEFIQKLDEPAYCKPWLTANPHKGFLAQGASVDIDLEVFVNRFMAPELNAGRQQIEDILVLHLDRGKDYFISVMGNYLPSCFGTSIRALCHLREPIQEMPLETIQKLTSEPAEFSSNPGEEPALEIPKEVCLMVDHLYRNANKQEDLFQQPGLRSEFEEIRDCLDTGEPDSLPGSNHSVAEALLLFLDALPEPVIPFRLYKQCLDCCSDYSQCKQVISKLPQCHRNVFISLTEFLRELLKQSAHNRLDVNILATIFAALMMRSPTKQDLSEKRKTQEFYQHFLMQDQF